MEWRQTVTRNPVAVFYHPERKKRKDEILLLTSSVVLWEHSVKSCQCLSSFDRNKSSGSSPPFPPSLCGGSRLPSCSKYTHVRWSTDSQLPGFMNGNVYFIVLGHSRIQFGISVKWAVMKTPDCMQVVLLLLQLVPYISKASLSFIVASPSAQCGPQRILSSKDKRQPGANTSPFKRQSPPVILWLMNLVKSRRGSGVLEYHNIKDGLFCSGVTQFSS